MNEARFLFVLYRIQIPRAAIKAIERFLDALHRFAVIVPGEQIYSPLWGLVLHVAVCVESGLLVNGNHYVIRIWPGIPGVFGQRDIKRTQRLDQIRIHFDSPVPR